MRLLCFISGRLELLDIVDAIPPYAILSHTWGDEKEFISEDMEKLSENKPRTRKGYEKISDVAFSQSQWFHRGWILQELLVPCHITFYNERWSWLDSRQDQSQRISRRAGIQEQVLEDPDERVKFSAAQKISWAARRRTTRTEDVAYFLHGMFGKDISALYREGNRGFYQYQQEILKTTLNLSFHAWLGHGKLFGDILVKTPRGFLGVGPIIEESGHEGICRGYQGTSRMPLSMLPPSRRYDRKDKFIATVDQRMELTQEEDIGEKDPQVLAWLTAIQETLTDGMNQHLGVRTALNQTEKSNKIPLGTPKEDGEDRTLFSSATWSWPPRIISSEKSSLDVQGTVPDVQTEDEECVLATNDEGMDDFRSESSDSSSESCSTSSKGSDDGEDELPFDIFIEVLVEVILERKGMPWHLLDVKKASDAKAEGGRYHNTLEAAAKGGHKQAVKTLLENGAEVNTQGEDFRNALQAAAARGSVEVVEMLLENGAEVNTESGEFRTALQAAVEGGHKQVVKMLLKNSAEVDTQGEKYSTALQAAVCRGYKQIVKLLLDKGAKFDTQGGNYSTALQAAVFRGHKQIVKMLLDKGAEANTKVVEDGTTLQAASEAGHDQPGKRRRLY